ncbi:MAG: hypothetical protein ACE5JR_13005 [Gemmatimonadota bacterium]
MHGRVALLLPGLVAMTPPVAAAQEADWPFHGFAQVNWSVRTTTAADERLLSEDFLLGEERLQLELERFSGDGRAGFFVKIDFFHDALSRRADLEVREAYIDLGIDPVALRLGRQIITWGVGDLIFINDVFPKDYAAFFSGRPLQYLKVGTDAFKGDFTSGVVSAELVLIPSFEPDRLPGPDRFVLFDPFPGVPRVERRPDLRLSNAELALRVYRRLLGADVSLHAYRGFHGSPALQPDLGAEPDTLLLSFPRLNVYGVSLQRAGFGGVVSGEFGYYDSREDPNGSDPRVPNSQIRALLGYQRQIWPESRLGIQYYAEWMQDHAAYVAGLGPEAQPRDEVLHVATLRFTQQLAYQTWELSLFLFVGLSEADYYVIPEIRHRLTEDLWLALGANVFGGDRQDLFGALDGNDNIYLVARFGF